MHRTAGEMKIDQELSLERRWAHGVICLAETTLPRDSAWLAATRLSLAASDDSALRLLRDALGGREKVSALSESQFDLYFGLQILLASRQAATRGRGDLLGTGSMPRGTRAITRKAESVLGTALKAQRWLCAPHPILGGAPLDLMGSKLGRRLVYEELARIDWGDLA